jgi:hypothetical protein
MKYDSKAWWTNRFGEVSPIGTVRPTKQTDSGPVKPVGSLKPGEDTVMWGIVQEVSPEFHAHYMVTFDSFDYPLMFNATDSVQLRTPKKFALSGVSSARDLSIGTGDAKDVVLRVAAFSGVSDGEYKRQAQWITDALNAQYKRDQEKNQ